MFSKRGKLKREFDVQLIRQFLETKQEWEKAQALEELSVEYDQLCAAERKISESKNLFLLKEARIRKMSMK
ncbi:YaaL family protein [Planococcus sp. FY231025]|uniref:YaaL family protein n=1 Tax=Planococcus chinensis TaxID=272917 RepID=A0ABW4QLT5_9BACL